MLKFNHYYFILLLCLIFGSAAYTQTTKWFVLNNSGYLINVIGADSDKEGNLYITGDYRGEVLFTSFKDSGTSHRNYTSKNWQQLFLIKYDSSGNFNRDFKILNHSGKNIYTITVKVLSTGTIAWIIRVDGKYSIIDKKGEEFPFQARGQSVLVLLSPKGEVLSQTALPFEYYSELVELGDDRLLLFGKAKQSQKNEVYLLDQGSLQIEQIFNDITDLYAVSVSDTKLFLLTTKYKRTQVDSAEIRLYSAEIDQLERSPNLLFTKRQSGSVFGPTFLFSKDDKVEVILTLNFRYGIPYTLDSLALTSKEDKLMLLRLNSRGEVTGKFSMNTKINGNYNTRLEQDNHGGYYLLSPVMEEIKILEQDSSTIVPKHGDFIHELVLFKLDKDLNFQWNFNLGGTASNSHHSFIVPDEKGLYFVTDLLDYVTIDGIFHELEWRAGLLLGRIKTK